MSAQLRPKPKQLTDEQELLDKKQGQFLMNVLNHVIHTDSGKLVLCLHMLGRNLEDCDGRTVWLEIVKKITTSIKAKATHITIKG